MCKAVQAGYLCLFFNSDGVGVGWGERGGDELVHSEGEQEISLSWRGRAEPL